MLNALAPRCGSLPGGGVPSGGSRFIPLPTA
jgi:hypothetical protein